MRIKILTPCWNFTFAIEIAYKWNYSCVGVMCTHKIKLYIVHPELSYWPNAKKICTSQTSCQMNKTCGLELNWRQNCEAWICFRGVIVISHFLRTGTMNFTAHTTTRLFSESVAMNFTVHTTSQAYTNTFLSHPKTYVFGDMPIYLIMCALRLSQATQFWKFLFSLTLNVLDYPGPRQPSWAKF